MKLLSDNLKKAGYFNAILIVIAIVFRLCFIGSFPTAIMIDSIVCTIALIFGLFYSLSGYKKDAAKYYKAFMYLYLVSSLLSFIASIASVLVEDKSTVLIVANAVVLVAVFILAFIKDLGAKKSIVLALAILVISVVKMCFVVLTTTALSLISIHFANLMLACILCVFVAAKYADKKSRGAK